MATTQALEFDAAPKNGYYPVDGQQIYTVKIANEDNMEALNAVLECIPVAEGAAPVDAWLALGDFDANGTPLVKHSLEFYDGATAYEIILDTTVGQAGGDIRCGAAAGDVQTPLGVAVTTSGALFRIVTTAAAATAQTASRTVYLMVVIRAMT